MMFFIQDILGKTIVIFLFVTFSCLSTSAQDIKVLGKNSFEHSGISYNRHTLRSVMEGNAEALEQYNRYLKVFENARLRRNVGGGAMIGGAVLTYVGIGAAIDSNSGGGLVYLAMVCTGMGAILVLTSLQPKQHLLDKAIDIYNDNPPDVGLLQPQLNLGLTANGAGVVYKF